jgi:SAM-dependent methyltransferase
VGPTSVEHLLPPTGRDTLPAFDNGWLTGKDLPDAFLAYADAAAVNWSPELEELHEGSSRDHFLDTWTRSVLLDRISDLSAAARIVDLGCSSGYLLDDLRAAHPHATLLGVDLVSSGLESAHALVPSALLLQADVCDLPLADQSADAIVSANLLEHVPDDRQSLAEMMRVLRAGGRAAIIVPAGPGTYDYYDRFLGHERRYGHGELAAKAREVGFAVEEDSYLGSLIYPAFWLVKKRNRLRFEGLEGEALKQRVARDIHSTHGSRVAAVLRHVEQSLNLRLPFGIRNLVLLSR